MTRRRSGHVASALAGLLLAAPPAAAEADATQGESGLSGNAKSVLLGSRTPQRGPYWLSLNRLRLELKGRPAKGVSIDLQVDQLVLIGSYLGTAAFRAAKDAAPAQYWRADAKLLDRGDIHAQAGLYRAWLTWSRDALDVKLGRQRIAWGTGRFWSPLDVLNPVNPLALEREERLGVDAPLVELKTGPLSRVSAVVAPAPDHGSTSRALLWHGNRGGLDLSLVGGRLLGADIVGGDVAGQLGAAGVRAEVARLRPIGTTGFVRATLGVDYAFDTGLTLSAELHYNGGGSRDPARYAPRTGPLPQASPATRYAGLFASWELTPLLKWNSWIVANLDDRSRGLDSRLVWSARKDVDLTVGFQQFGGRPSTEFGGMPWAVFAQTQWYF
jgi:hypothetical protein